MKSIWVTYAWDDNADGDVDFAAQELIKAGVKVRLDRWNLSAGKRLWEQIEQFIQDPSESDGWLLYATQASLGSQACKEEFAYALDRALDTRGGDFPVIALFPAPVDEGLIPAGIKTRLFVSLTDPDWKERIVAAVERREATITRSEVEPYELRVHEWEAGGAEACIIEMRPRAGTWSPFVVAIPAAEHETVAPMLNHGAARRPPTGPVVTAFLHNVREGVSADGRWWFVSAGNEASPTQSYYVTCQVRPSIVVFGVADGEPQYQVEL